jgi:hypothetical protein
MTHIAEVIVEVMEDMADFCEKRSEECSGRAFSAETYSIKNALLDEAMKWKERARLFCVIAHMADKRKDKDDG